MGKTFRAVYYQLMTMLCSFRKKRLTYEHSFSTTAYGPHVGQYLYEKHISTTAGIAGEECNKIAVNQITEAKKKHQEVPIWVCLVLIVGYNLLGSLLFTVWEDWDFLTGVYFCFVTLSTIGFGDVVPGSSIESWHSHEKRLLCTLWLLFGLTLIAMCFDLMQRQVRQIVTDIAQRIGLIEDTKTKVGPVIECIHTDV